MTIILKDAWEIDLMRQAGGIVAEVLDMMPELIRPGVSTEALDAAAEKLIRSRGALPTFKGYRRYPKSICASINEEIVHGIPSPHRILKEGDIVGIDVGATYKGYVGDGARTFGVGAVTKEAQRLMETTRECLERAIATMRPGSALSDIGRAVQTLAESRGYSVVRKFVGHGIGSIMHEDPQVPNYVDPDSPVPDVKLKAGMVLAIEPMINVGTCDTKILKDAWTVVTADGKLSAHFEHTIAVTAQGHEILTLR